MAGASTQTSSSLNDTTPRLYGHVRPSASTSFNSTSVVTLRRVDKEVGEEVGRDLDSDFNVMNLYHNLPPEMTEIYQLNILIPL